MSKRAAARKRAKVRCEICNHEYPEDLLNSFSSSAANLERICGICALALSNKVHGANRGKFNGERAEQLRQAAIVWRERGTRP